MGPRAKDICDGCVIRARRGDRELQAAVGADKVVVEGQLRRPVAREERQDGVSRKSRGVDRKIERRSSRGGDGPVVQVARRPLGHRTDLADTGVADRDGCRCIRRVVGFPFRSEPGARDGAKVQCVPGQRASSISPNEPIATKYRPLAGTRNEMRLSRSSKSSLNASTVRPIGRKQDQLRIERRAEQLRVDIRAEQLAFGQIHEPDVDVSRGIHDPTA